MSVARNKLKFFLYPLSVVLITLVVSVSVLGIYLRDQGPLRGNFDQFFLPAKKFGVPADLRLHGIKELFKDDLNTGWDGQFYYYISNDLLAQKDTASHIDSNAYRYQRIGLPLLANAVSKLTLRSWVSPLTYYLTSLSVILFATGIAAFFFQRRGWSSYWVLPWSLGMGTLLTQLHGLPDAAADGFLIIGLISLLQRQSWLYVITMTFAALSREIYIVIPGAMILSLFMSIMKHNSYSLKKTFSCKQVVKFIQGSLIHLIPIIIWIGWQIIIRIKFGVSPSSQASGILGFPFSSTFHYMLAGLAGNHPLVGIGRNAHLEGLGVLLNLILCIFSIFYFCKLLSKTNDERQVGLSLGFIFIIGLYQCFGPTVMMHHTGFFKATNIFMFLIPFVACIGEFKINKVVILFLISVTLFFDCFLWNKISAPPYVPDDAITYATHQPACLKKYNAHLILVSTVMHQPHGFIRKLFNFRNDVIMNTEVQNTSNDVFSAYLGVGSVNVSYQWVDKNTLAVVKDGARVMLPQPLKPNQKVVVPIVVHFPTKPGDYILKLSLVQEGCSWFYLANPESVVNLHYILIK